MTTSDALVKRLTLAVLAWGVLLMAEAGADEAPATFDLIAGPAAGRIDRVMVELEVGGQLQNPKDPSDRTSKTIEAPMSVQGKLVYDERWLSDSRSARHYRTAEATIKAGARGKSPRLPHDRKLLVANSDTEHVRLFAPAGPLTRDQLDLVEVIGATLGVDALLPIKAVAEGEEWKVDGPAMGRLLGLDSVGLCEVTSLIDDANPRYARFQLAGMVHGTIDGAATEIDLRGIGLFSLEQKRLTQLNLAIREDRKVGPATPGFQGVAKARIKIDPISESAELRDDVIAELKTIAEDASANDASAPLLVEAEKQGFRFAHDRHWFAAGDDRRSLMMRRINGVDLAAQATFTVGEESTALSLADFESQVRSSLGDGLKEFVSSEQWTNPAGCRCMGIVAQGTVADVLVQWRYYQAAPPEGATTNGARRVTLAATIEPTADASTAENLREMIDSLEFTPPKKLTTAKRRTKRRRKR